VVAVVPAYNEADSIGAVVAALAGLSPVSEVVVVCDGSTDGTAGKATAAGAWTWITPQRRGKGRAVDGALDWIGPADAFLLVDGDVGDTAAAATLLVDRVMLGEVDLAIGTLPPASGGGFGLVKGVARRLIWMLTGFRPEEPLSGQRAVAGIALEACRPLAGGFGLETAMTIDAVRLGLRVEEAPVAISHRATGRGPAGFLHRARQGVDIMRAVWPRAMRLR